MQTKTKEDILKPYIYKNVESFGDCVSVDGAESAMSSYSSHLEERIKMLEEAMQHFVDRVEKGEVRSVRTYEKFKQLLTKK